MIGALSVSWFHLRNGRTTGSNLGAFIGFCPDKPPESAWRGVRRYGEKEEFKPYELKRMEAGRIHEEDNADMLDETIHRKTGESPVAIDPFFPWLSTTPDRYGKRSPMNGLPFVVECKCPERMYSHPPLHYVVQTYEEMRGYGAKFTYFSAWTPKQYKLWIILWDERFWAFICNLLQRVWQFIYNNMPVVHNIQDGNFVGVPFVGPAAYEWCQAGYTEEARKRIIDSHGLKDWMLPMAPVYALVLHQKGTYEGKKGINITHHIVYKNNSLIEGRDAVDLYDVSDKFRHMYDKNRMFVPMELDLPGCE